MNAPGTYVVGQKHTVEITIDDEGRAVAQCRGAQASFQHGPNWCDWRETYDSLRDALEYCGDHANKLRS